jgi:hypothetical protein
MLKLDASPAISEIEDTELCATLAPYVNRLIFATADYDLGVHNPIG